MKLNRKVAIIAATTAAAMGAAGVGFAYVTETSNVSATGGTGTATPTVGTVSNLTWSAGTAAAGLVPGGAAQNVTITLSNGNPYSVNIGAWKFAVSSASGTGCTNAQANLSGNATTPATFIVPGKIGATNGTNTFTVPVSMGDLPAVDQGGCIGVPLTVTFGASDQNSPDVNN
jgi:hypothetical protein